MLTITEFKAYNNITSTDNDSTINICISASIDYVENYCCRKLQSGSYTDYKYGNGEDYMYLDGKYIQSVNYINEYDGESFVAFESGSTRIDNDYNKIELYDGYTFYEDTKYEINYNSGYTTSTVPNDLKIVLMELATILYTNSGISGVSRLGINTINMSSVTSDGTSYMNLIQMNEIWSLILSKYQLIKI